MTRAMCHFDNAYWLPHGPERLLRPHPSQSNTAFRWFWRPQRALAIEYILDSVARQLSRDPLDVRLANLYGQDDCNTTPYGQVVDDNILPALLDELAHSSQYRERRQAIAKFNAHSPVLKKGLALTP